METQENNEDQINDPQNKTGMTDQLRRKYPVHAKGGKSEWVGMIQHQGLIKDELEKTEKGIKMLKLKTLMNEYEKQQLEQLEKKQAELNQKKLEYEDSVQKKQMFDQARLQYKQDLTVLKNGLHQHYSQDIQMKNDAKQYFRNQEIEMEKKLLEENRKKLESEERKKKEKKEREKQMAWEQIENNRVKKMEQRNDDRNLKTEISELQKKNAVKEVTKEENYKNFYKICSQNQSALMNLHKSQVVDPRNERERQINEMIAKGVAEERIRQYQKEQDRLQKKHEDAKFVFNTNQYLVTEHENLKSNIKEEKNKEKAKRLEDLASYQEYLKFKKQEKADMVSEYKNVLEKQYEERDNKIINQFRMTRNEKKLNYFDLQAYKGQEPALYSMIPGWSPQVGGVLKPFQKVDPKLSDNLINNNNTSPTEEGQNLSPPLKKQPYFAPNALVTNLAVNVNPTKYQPQFQSNLKGNFEVKSPMGLQTNLNAQLQNQLEKIGNGNYVSPKSGNVLLGDGGNLSNPYILRELQKNRNIFSKIGQESLTK